ncbi:hypothetical protein CYL31_11940 [Marinomonas sp. A3A]|uniref:hypothetical protein n=1 Tax=Marinomonas sp. A3A TaxID=2065312 RepID=UPI001BB3B731|nr:hypothetical protein [Marinomonas sp. A3A]QUX92078.1 hypothetical protein CYL31_11940 [Marinomonas sp. A3A]
MLYSKETLVLSLSYDEILSKCQYPIVGQNKNSKKWEVIGTCVLLKIGGRHFFITAAHVMNARHHLLDKTLWLWNHADERKTTINEDIVCIPGDDVEHGADFAIIEIDISEYQNLNSNQSLDLDYVSLDLNVVDDAMGFLITGYPSSKNKMLGSVNNPAKMFYVVTRASDSEVFPTAITLEYANKMLESQDVTLPKPQGMSGGGVWKITESEKELKLVALSVAYLKNENRVIAVKINLVLSMIKHYFPNTDLDKLDLPIKVVSHGLDAKVMVPILPKNLGADEN